MRLRRLSSTSAVVLVAAAAFLSPAHARARTVDHAEVARVLSAVATALPVAVPNNGAGYIIAGPLSRAVDDLEAGAPACVDFNGFASWIPILGPGGGIDLLTADQARFLSAIVAYGNANIPCPTTT